MSLLDDEEPLSSFEVALELSSEGNEFHTLNASPNDYERRNVIERTQGSVHIYCDLMDVKHGNLGTDENNEDDLATLMVFRFRFEPQKNGRRVYRARIKIEFLSSGRLGSAPEVEAIAPEERWSLMPTQDTEALKKGSEVNLGVSAASFVNATGKVTLEKTTTRDVTSATTVTGAMNLGTGANCGAYTAAVWTLLENEKRSSGVPDSVRVAVLIRREDNEPFIAVVTLEAEADVATSLKKFFRTTPLDDPVLFNPKAQLKHDKYMKLKGRQCGVRNLGEVNLYTLCDARMSPAAFWAEDQEKSGSMNICEEPGE
ncbi:hypothetical protein VSDG_05533 [Cytospora chrysosperma]|uniref:Uncharacterized protein n=1 Tax=Cytospora chrysosperma TaxID=252740 RepID=A0A423W0F1_CYTCH|nr:hypothetical protein VSDG_05533 [Valsa sordida]